MNGSVVKPEVVVALLVALLVFPTLLLADADLQSSLEVPSTVLAGQAITYRGSVTNLGPDPAGDIRVSFDGVNYRCVQTTPVDPLLPGESRPYECTHVPPFPPYGAGVRFSAASASTPDPNTANNDAVAWFTILSSPDIVAWVSIPSLIDPGLPFYGSVFYANRAAMTATGVRFAVEMTGITGFLSLSPGCSAEGSRLVCEAGPVEGMPTPILAKWERIDFEAVAERDDRLTVQAFLTAALNEPDADPTSNHASASAAMYHLLEVTSAADSGSGTLRSAIEAANAECNGARPCKIGFSIPLASGESFATIAPLTPLPAITATDVVVDGSTQTRGLGDANAAGPEIVLSGSAIATNTPADGLELRTRCSATVQHLVINGWSGNGIAINDSEPCTAPALGATRMISDNYIGTDPTGVFAVPNFRGILMNATVRYPQYAIARNLISGNTRSGIYAISPYPEITANTIGLNAQRTAGLGNGASGIYFGPQSGHCDVRDNHIAFNGHAGISIDSNAALTSVTGNSIHANGSIGIDFGLDGTTEEVPADFTASVRAPVIESATWDPSTATTTVTGKLPPGKPHYGWFDINLYANDACDPSGFGEGQYALGHVPTGADFTFRIVYPGNLRGKALTATTTRRYYGGFALPPQDHGDWQGFLETTSEFGRCFTAE